MKATLSINYHTRWGQRLFIDMAGERIPMEYCGGDGLWIATIDIPCADNTTYSYVVVHDNGSEIHEWGQPRVLAVDSSISHIAIYDYWRDKPANAHLYSSAFKNAIFGRGMKRNVAITSSGFLRIGVNAPFLRPGQTIAICGSCRALGCWEPAKAVRLSPSTFPEWTALIPMSAIDANFEYKFIILDTATSKVISWEEGENRRFNTPVSTGVDAVAISGLYMADPFPQWRGSGVVLPVFSLRSDDDFGVGDFYDIRLLVDWATSLGMSMIQILPVNDTTMTGRSSDSYPYNANSTIALHPMYLRVDAILPNSAPPLPNFKTLQHELNSLPDVDYERVNNAKNHYTHIIFEQYGQATLESDEYKKFVSKNSEWLLPYAVYCTLRDRYATPDTSRWGEYARYDSTKIHEFALKNTDAINYVCFIQYHLDRQLRHVSDYARSKGVALKGDIPIGVSSNSVDAWAHPDLFNLSTSAGAPPDDFSALGQNWGFPTYNWEAMARDGYSWWKRRFRKMSEYFDAYRIDHILGFFRIWQIPVNAIHGLLGIFYPSLPLTPDEMRYGYDFSFDAERYTIPYITDDTIESLMGDDANEVKRIFLTAIENGGYVFRREFDTQRKVAAFFASREHDEHNKLLCAKLLDLFDEVLFIEDSKERGKYHPRICAYSTAVYNTLNDYERWCFDRLYHDFYYVRHNEFWREKALSKLPPLIDATDMLVCGEDLGMIPGCVHPVMRDLKILSLEIERMPKDYGIEFANTSAYPYLSICATSTHDMSGIRQWWEEDYSKSSRYYHEVLQLDGDAPLSATPQICEKILENNLKSPSVLCVFPWQDWFAVDGENRHPDPAKERINIPADSNHYWRYRMHIPLKNLSDCTHASETIRRLIRQSGR